jgi:hypothetical protein
MGQAVIRRPFTAEALFGFMVILCELFGGQSGTGTVFLRVLWLSHISIIPLMLNSVLRPHFAVTRRTNGRSLGTLPKATVFRKSGNIG